MFRSLAAAMLSALCLWGQAAPRSTPDEIAVVREINKIRRFPREYAKYLRALGLRFEGTLWRLADHVPIRTQEGRAAVIEAAEFLERVEPVTALIAYDENLHLAARDHVADQGPTGETGHIGTDGSRPSQRMRRHGEPGSLTGEVINYGLETPRMTVIQLVIDDGVKDRGHRHNLFNPAFRAAGAAIGDHKAYGTMVVVDLADTFTPKEKP
ncbi:CAP domain-containing protein [Mesoterricola silvestris]|uniref:Serine protease n=1 Tax=Mesoterricola silvestris TaxID=2927979 RepID=A0AA48GR40_9BACT|nr:CAP domain-containing protein [Mesoterricola silvestris]BDU74579.1 serine protease [Mesoterricola silvestris]